MPSDLDLTLPNVADDHLQMPNLTRLGIPGASTHPPRILLLYGSLRERSYSRFLTLEAERILRRLGALRRVRRGERLFRFGIATCHGTTVPRCAPDVDPGAPEGCAESCRRIRSPHALGSSVGLAEGRAWAQQAFAALSPKQAG